MVDSILLLSQRGFFLQFDCQRDHRASSLELGAGAEARNDSYNNNKTKLDKVVQKLDLDESNQRKQRKTKWKTTFCTTMKVEELHQRTRWVTCSHIDYDGV